MSSIACLSLSQDDVALPGNAFRNSDGELSITYRLERSLNWTGDGSEGGMNVASVCVKAAAGYQIYLRAYYYGVYRAYRERKEGLHG